MQYIINTDPKYIMHLIFFHWLGEGVKLPKWQKNQNHGILANNDVSPFTEQDSAWAKEETALSVRCRFTFI